MKGTPHRPAEVAALRVLTTCDACGKQFMPSRRSVGTWLSRQPKYRFCSQVCGRSYTHYMGGEWSRKFRANVKREDSCAAIEQNATAKFYCVKSPDNIRYTFRNMYNFIREHAHLFPPGYADHPIATAGRLKKRQSKAGVGLSRLFYTSKHQAESYLGWQGVWKKDRLGAVQWQRAT